MLNSKPIMARRARKKVLAFRLPPSALACSGFTMVEIAICLAIIGIALIAIIGVLPLGINVQKDNRQETLVDQDATVFLNAIRTGAFGLDDLTNYVFAITNSWTQYNSQGGVIGSGINGYTYTAASVNGTSVPYLALTNGANIIGLLSTPEYTTAPSKGVPIPNLIYGGVSNHVVAYVRSLSGPAAEQPPQDNPIVRDASLSYKIICNNAPVAVYTPPLWQANHQPPYKKGDEALLNGITWRATVTPAVDKPGTSAQWAQDTYSQQLTANLHELRLTFLWPLLPTGNIGPGRHTFATTVAGQIVPVPYGGYSLYFFQPQTFTQAP